MSKTILIVDDSATLRMTLKLTLQEAGYQIIEAVDGRDGLDKLTQCHPALIISDLNMPRMGGFMFVDTVKQLPEHKFTPIIMLTTEAGSEKKAAGRIMGVKAWMIKPFKPDQILAAVAKLVQP